MSQLPRPGQPNPHVERSGTLIETEDDVRQAMLAGLKGPAPFPASHPIPPPPPAPSPMTAAPPPQPVATRSANVFRPTARPPIPLLIVFDDGRMEGEVIRIREPRFVIGRTEGDLRFPLDGRMSGRHVEITHQYVGGVHRWVGHALAKGAHRILRIHQNAILAVRRLSNAIRNVRFILLPSSFSSKTTRVFCDW